MLKDSNAQLLIGTSDSLSDIDMSIKKYGDLIRIENGRHRIVYLMSQNKKEAIPIKVINILGIELIRYKTLSIYLRSNK